MGFQFCSESLGAKNFTIFQIGNTLAACRPERATAHPAQGNALGTGNNGNFSAQRASSHSYQRRMVGPLGRKCFWFALNPQGVALGWVNRWTFGP
jgi:hypothetical protein